MVANTLRDLPAVVRHPAGISEGVLPLAAVYGANASGKTNILRALGFMEIAVRNSHRNWPPEGPINTEPFLLDENSTKQPTVFEADLLIGGTRYEYGFALTRERIVREWLYAYPNVRRQVWFTRDAANESRTITFGKHLSGENQAIANLTRANSLFLSAAAQNNHAQLSPIYQWFNDKLHFVNERQRLVMRTAEHCIQEDDVRGRIKAAMSAADLGIVGLEVTEEELDERMQVLVSSLTKHLATLYPDRGQELQEPVPRMPKVVLLHKGSGEKQIPFETDGESAGTLAWFGVLGPVFGSLKHGWTLCIDELDSSLHPVLASQLVRLYNDPARNPSNAQLIFNTHDTNLLDPSVCRRDQIWFVEKDAEGASHLYPLTDFKPRKLENLEKGYLQGRYGAVPFIGSLELIFDGEHEVPEG